jgi:nucleoside-diphosphate-sugar epimerase
MVLFVTGGTGFIGSHFIKMAIERNHEVYALIREGGVPKINLTKDPIWIKGGLTDDHNHILKKCDMFVHIASYGVSPQPAKWQECIDVNVVQSMHICQSAINAGIKKLLVFGTSLECGFVDNDKNILTDTSLSQMGAYASSKSAFFQLLYGLSIEKNISLYYMRLFTTYGEGQYKNNLWPSMYSAAMSGDDYKIMNGDNVRDFIYVKDAITKVLNIVALSNNGKKNINIHNICSGKKQTVFRFSEYWWHKWNARGNLNTK